MEGVIAGLTFQETATWLCLCRLRKVLAVSLSSHQQEENFKVHRWDGDLEHTKFQLFFMSIQKYQLFFMSNRLCGCGFGNDIKFLVPACRLCGVWFVESSWMDLNDDLFSWSSNKATETGRRILSLKGISKLLQPLLLYLLQGWPG